MASLLKDAFIAAATAKNDLPVTAGRHRWHTQGRHMTPQAIARVQQVMMNDLLGRSDGSGRHRFSMIGDHCLRRQELSCQGYPKSDFEEANLDVMESGTWRHYYWQCMGLSQLPDGTPGFLEDIEVKMEDPGWPTKGSADGLITDGSLFELKTTNERIYGRVMKDNEPKFEHRLQVGAEMRIRKADKASIVYENRGFPNEWHEFRMEMDQAVELSLAHLRRVARRSHRLKELPEMLAECIVGEGEFTKCDYAAVCPTAKWRLG